MSVHVISMFGKLGKGKPLKVKSFAIDLTSQLYQSVIISSKIIFYNPYPAAVEILSASVL